MNSPRWPISLTLVRHGESEGNLADLAAQRSGAEVIVGEHDIRDADVELSDDGQRQAQAVGRWLSKLSNDERPDVAYTSPYVRAQHTAEIAVAECSNGVTLKRDERLRERELGLLDGLTSTGIRKRLPDEVERREWLGKFYYRPPVGESWADVALRVRSLLATLQATYAGQRVLVVTHQAVIMVFRYVLEELPEQELLEIDRSGQLANCSITRYEAAGGDEEMSLIVFNDVSHLELEAEPVTKEPDATPAS